MSSSNMIRGLAIIMLLDDIIYNQTLEKIKLRAMNMFEKLDAKNLLSNRTSMMMMKCMKKGYLDGLCQLKLENVT